MLFRSRNVRAAERGAQNTPGGKDIARSSARRADRFLPGEPPAENVFPRPPVPSILDAVRAFPPVQDKFVRAGHASAGARTYEQGSRRAGLQRSKKCKYRVDWMGLFLRGIVSGRVFHLAV